MILTCPSCGATASAAAWENDMAARETLQAMLALPAPVGKAILGYMGLFRPDKRALSWRKAKRIVDELAALIGPGFNSRKINQILLQIGLQCEIKKRPFRNSKTERVVGYEPTDFGLEHAVLGKNGRMWVKHLKWRDTVIPLIKASMTGDDNP